MSQLLQVAARRQPSITGIDATTAPFYVSEGVPYDVGGVAIDSVSPITNYHQGIPFTANGRIAADINAPTYFGSGGAPFTPTGRLSIQTTATDHVLAGVPFSILSGVRGEANAPSFGPEIFTGWLNINAPWTGAGLGPWSIDGSQVANADLRNNAGVTPPNDTVLQFNIDVLALSGGSSFLYGYSSTPLISLVVGMNTVTHTKNSNNLILRANVGTITTVNSVSIKEVL